MYLYPDNLTARPMLWLWALRDVALIGIGLLLSALALAQTGFVTPLVVTAVSVIESHRVGLCIVPIVLIVRRHADK